MLSILHRLFIIKPSSFQVQSGAQTPFKKWLLNFAIERKHAEVKQGIIRNDSIWDKFIFHKVQVSPSGLNTQLALVSLLRRMEGDVRDGGA